MILKVKTLLFNVNFSAYTQKLKNKKSEALFGYYQLERLRLLKSLRMLKTHVQTKKCNLILNFIFLFEHIFFINSAINKKLY